MAVHFPDWLEAILPAFLAAGAGLVGYGKLQSRVNALERAQRETSADHDVIVRMGEQHSIMKEDLTEIKADVKALLQKL